MVPFQVLLHDIYLNKLFVIVIVIFAHFMVFHRSLFKTSKINRVLEQNTIDRVNSTKFLGLLCDDKLRWHEHIQHVKHKIARLVGILYKIGIILTNKPS